VGVALIGLGGVHLIFLMVSPKFIAIFPMLPDPIPYLSESKLLSSLQRFFDLATCFLIVFSSFSNFLLDCTKEFFVGLGFFPPFLVVWKWVFPIRLSHTYDNYLWCA
jgi:hypothetical protein